jgi:hypothetical protein
LKQTDVFESRLQSWADLRTRLWQDSISTALQSLNSWWFEIAWCPYLLHWDDQSSWPDPWELLEQQALCDVARGLGIMYTIAMLDRKYLGDFVLFEETEHNLVLVRSEKYILNYSSNDILNTSLEIGKTKKRRSQTLADIKTRIK